jgi:hypothetical protein
VYADIVATAERMCARHEAQGVAVRRAEAECVSLTVDDAVTRSGDPALRRLMETRVGVASVN